MSSTNQIPEAAFARLRIAVLAGGDSAEREISLQSGRAVTAALQQAGHRVEQIDPKTQSLDSTPWNDFDVAFIALHGTHGEDGEVQRKLQSLGVVFTGSGEQASHLAFHKLEAKQKFLESGLKTPEYRIIEAGTNSDDIVKLAAELGYPLVVKPEAQGSSLGVTMLASSSQLEMAVEHARELDEIVLLERAIPGQEWTVPVFDSVALPPIRIGTPHQFFDFHAKYFDEQTEYEVVTDPDHPIAGRVQKVSIEACQTLRCSGVSRVDLRVDPQGEIWLLEVNTIPGMTDHSLVPKAAAAHGWPMSRLCEEIVYAALRSHHLRMDQS